MIPTPTVVALPEESIARFAAMPYGDGLVALWNAILSACGKPSLGEATDPIRPGDYQIPRAHGERLLAAWMASATPYESVSVGMHYVNVGPSAADVD